MNESEERYVGALKKDIKNFEKQIAEFIHSIKELEEYVEEWQTECDNLRLKTQVQESYIDAIQDAVTLVQTEETLREMIAELDRLVCMLSEEEKDVVEEARKEML